MTNCLIVKVYGRPLDELRGEASRISRAQKADWFVERDDKGMRFCFEDGEAKAQFASVCKNLGLIHSDA